MIIGIGTDIVEIERIMQAIDRNTKFIQKVLSEEEIDLGADGNLKPEFVAGRFAAKEAVSKALGTGFRSFGFKDIVIINDELGKPVVSLKGKAKDALSNYGDYKIHISISHERKNAIAFVVIEA